MATRMETKSQLWRTKNQDGQMRLNKCDLPRIRAKFSSSVLRDTAYLYCPDHVKCYCCYDWPFQPSPPCVVPALYECLPSKSPSQSRCQSAVAAAGHGTATGAQPRTSPITQPRMPENVSFHAVLLWLSWPAIQFFGFILQVTTTLYSTSYSTDCFY